MLDQNYIFLNFWHKKKIQENSCSRIPKDGNNLNERDAKKTEKRKREYLCTSEREESLSSDLQSTVVEL